MNLELSDKEKAILDSVPAGVFFKDDQNIILWANKPFAETMGRTQKELEGKSMFDLYPRELAQAYWRDDLEVIKTGQRKMNIVERVEIGGKVLWGQTNKMPLKDAEGKIVGVIGSATDITEEKAAEERLKESEERYRALFEDSFDAIMMIAPPEWNFTSANAATLKLFGIKDMAEMATLQPWMLSPEKQPDGQLSIEKAREMINKAVKEGYVFFNWVHKKRDGTEFPALVSLSGITIAGKTVVQAIVKDVTAEKKAETELASRMVELERMNKLMVGRELKMIELKERVRSLEDAIAEKK